MDVHSLQAGRRNIKLALNSRHKTFCCVLLTVADEKCWRLVQLSGSQSTLKIHVADTKMPLLKVANHNKVRYVCIYEMIFIFSFFFLFREMRTASQNPFKTHFIDGCSRTAFIIPPTFARQLYSGKGRVSYTEGHCWEQET